MRYILLFEPADETKIAVSDSLEDIIRVFHSFTHMYLRNWWNTPAREGVLSTLENAITPAHLLHELMAFWEAEQEREDVGRVVLRAMPREGWGVLI